MSVLPGARARRSASLACAPVTLLYCGLLCCTLYDVSCNVWLLRKTYAAGPSQPISVATADQQVVAWHFFVRIISYLRAILKNSHIKTQ